MKLLIGALLLVVIVVTVNAILAGPDARAAQKAKLSVVNGGAAKTAADQWAADREAEKLRRWYG